MGFLAPTTLAIQPPYHQINQQAKLIASNKLATPQFHQTNQSRPSKTILTVDNLYEHHPLNKDEKGGMVRGLQDGVKFSYAE